MKKIYKKDNKNKLRVYQTHTLGDLLIQETGLVDGTLVRNEVECKPKNTGKKNATTGAEQAVLEMNARIKKKLREGYFTSMEEAKHSVVMLPMLALDYKKVKKIEYPCHAQPKLDGMRCLASKDMRSRKGVEIETMGHIGPSIDAISATIDGELYAHGLSFQENMKLIKKRRDKVGDEPGTIDVFYHVYDMVSDKPFKERYDTLYHIVKGLPFVKAVETIVIYKEEDLKEYHQKNIERGYEGTIIRCGETGYELNKRSKSLLKYKDFIDNAYEIVDIIPSDRRPEQGLVVCKHGDQTFKATPKMTHKEKEELLTNKADYIGKMAEIRYFEETDSGLPRFPVCYGFRLDK